MNNSVFGETMKNIRKNSDIKFVATKRTRSCLVSEPNYHTTKTFSQNFSNRNEKKTKVVMNKPVCLGLSVLESQ